MKECVLVTGGAGYIGTHTAVELIAAGYDVVVVDNLSNSERAAVDGVREITGAEIPFEQVDCDDKAALAGVFDKYKFNSVIHFAASKAVGESVEKPLLYYRNNILSLVNVLELMREKGVRNIVFSSSCTVYGQPEVLPVTEQTPRQPATSPYGNTKQICEDILRDTTAAYGELYGIALRYFNPIGAHPSALIWQPRSVYYADGGRDSAVPEYFRGRLRYVGRFGCPGLYRRGRPGPRACGGGRPDGRRQEPVELRVFQRGHRSGAFGDRTGRNV